MNDLSNGLPADEVQIRQSDPANGSGRLLTTTSGFSGIGSQDAPGDVNGFVGDEDYQVSITITRTSATDVQVDTELTDGAGIILNSVSTTAAATSFDFSFLGLSTSSGAFGASSSLNDPDNGLRLTNVFVEFTPAAVPEPSSVMLLGLLGCVGMIRRRR